MNDSSDPSDSKPGKVPKEPASKRTDSAKKSAAPALSRTEALAEPGSPVEEALADELAREKADRREFLQKAGSVLIGGAIVAGPAAVAIRVAIDPLTKKGQGGGVLARLTTVDALVPGGPPQAFKVIADKTDAWTTYKELPLGMVYVQRNEDDTLSAFSATCPHLGCVVEFRNTEAHGEHFYCPCHESSFHVDGSLAPNNTQAKRGLDSLEIDEEKLAAGEVWVRFQKFKANIVEKKPIA